MRNVPVIDATGLRALEGVVTAAHRDGTVILLSGVHKQPVDAMKKAKLIEKIGHTNFHKDVAHALDHARRLLQEE